MKKIILANPRGFCAGVRRAVQSVEKAIEKYGSPAYLNHPIVHNEHVVRQIIKQGAIFVDSIQDIPLKSVVIFSAHGVSPQIRDEAKKRDLNIIDATCPLVARVHAEVRKFFEQNYTIFFIGRKDHPEVIGVMGEAPIILIENELDTEKINIKNKDNIVCLTQTTLCISDTEKIISKLKKKFPNLVLSKGGTICYATQNRQNAVERLSGLADLVLVIGSKQSSNSNRLVEVARKNGVKSCLVSSVADLKQSYKKIDVQNIGITAGASTPEALVQEVVDYFKKLFPNIIIEELNCKDENMVFALPL